MSHRLAWLVLSLTLVGCREAAPPVTDALAPVKAADAAFQKAIGARDLDAITAFYAEDAVLMPTAEPIVKGKAAIRDEWKHMVRGALPSTPTTPTLSHRITSRSSGRDRDPGTADPAPHGGGGSRHDA